MAPKVHRDVERPSSVVIRLRNGQLAWPIFINQGLLDTVPFSLDLSLGASHARAVLAKLVLVKPQILAVLNCLIIEGAILAFLLCFLQYPLCNRAIGAVVAIVFSGLLNRVHPHREAVWVVERNLSKTHWLSVARPPDGDGVGGLREGFDVVVPGDAVGDERGDLLRAFLVHIGVVNHHVPVYVFCCLGRFWHDGVAVLVLW